MDKLLLIDGNSLLFRAYYATAYGGPSGAMRTSSGIPTNAIYAFSNIISKVLIDDKPDYVLVAFDTSAPTFRHLKYETYKAGRSPAPEDLVKQFPISREFLKAAGLFTFEIEGYEADDIVGTMSRIGSENDLAVHILSGDRDLLQLINDNVTVYLTKTGVSELKIMDATVLNDELGITPNQIIDLKGLMGDASDNIPGIAGVGEKTALKLLKEFSTVEKVLEATISGKLGEKIAASKEVAMMSKDLATIDQNVPLPFDLGATKFSGLSFDSLINFYQKYEMKSLVKRLQSQQVVANPVEEQKCLNTDNGSTINQKPNITIVSKVPLNFFNSESIAVVSEINGDNYHRDDVIGMGLSNGCETYFISIQDAINDEELIQYLKSEQKKYGYDVKQTINSLARFNIEVNNFDFDLYLCSYLLQSALRDEPKDIFGYYGNDVPEVSEVYSKSAFDLNKVAEFAGLKAYFVFASRLECLEKLREKDLLNLFVKVEMPVTFILAEMERQGVCIDLNLLNELSKNIDGKLESIAAHIYDLAGEKYNILSPLQTANILFDKLNLPANRKRSTSAEELDLLSKFHPIVALILDYRKYAKLQSVYLKGLPTYVLGDGKIHTIYNQALTQTGRLSSKEPNLQNITIRDEESREVRKAFVASKPGWYILSFDYSQIELRVLAHLANATSMIDAFNSGIDIHTATAMKIFGLKKEEISSSMRRQAKVVNFGIVYGMSDWGLADELGIPVREAKEFIEKYFASYPEIRSYLDNSVKECQEKGYSKTYFGRIRYVPEINDSKYNLREFGKRVAMNSPIQGTAADIIKMAMVEVNSAIKNAKLQTTMILQVHDELVFEVPFDELMTVIPLIEQSMQSVVDFKVKLEASYDYGYNWFF